MTQPTPFQRQIPTEQREGLRTERVARIQEMRRVRADRKRLRDKAEIAWLAAGNTRPLMEMNWDIINAEIEKERAKEKPK